MSCLTSLFRLGGISLTLTYFVPLNHFTNEWPIMVLNLIGRISSINTLAVCYVYSAEVFPTVVRTAGLGSSSFWARVGPMVRSDWRSRLVTLCLLQIAPFIVEGMTVYGAQVPLVVFGIASLMASFLVTFMPETSNTRLPDLIEEGEKIGSGDSLWGWCCKRKRSAN